MNQLDDTTKQDLRLAAIGALLHNLGKIHAKFLDKQVNNANNDYLYQHVLSLIGPHVSKLPSDWKNNYTANKLTASDILDNSTVTALTTAFSLPEPLNDRTDYTIGDLIEYLGQGEPWYREDNGQHGIEHIFSNGSRLTHLMNRAHRGASGGEKEDIAAAQQPDAAHLYLSTPFGYEMAVPNINNINDLLQKIEAVIQKYLIPLVSPFPLADFMAEIRPLLSQAIADTQRPLNDVTVGDIGHTGMAFLLTQAVEWILTQRSVDHEELSKKETDNTLCWRVLTIQTDSLRYLEEAASLADLRVRQRQLQEIFQKIRQQLEETLLAVEIYADEQRHLFLFPNLDQNTPTCQVTQDVISNFSMDGLRLTSHLSEPVTNHPKDKNGTYIGDQVLAELQKAPPYDFDARTIAAFWSDQTSTKQRCIACNVRPQGFGAEQIEDYKHNPTYYRAKAQGRNICCICMERRTGVAQKWAEDELNTTVWLDEVADSNSRLALIVGTWDLTYFIKSISYPQKRAGMNERQEPNFHLRLEQPTPRVHFTSLRGTSCPTQIKTGRSPVVTYKQNDLGWFTGEQGHDCPNKFKTPTFPYLNLAVDDIYLENGEYFIRLVSPHQRSGTTQLIGENFEVIDCHTLKTVDKSGRNKVTDLFLYDNQFIVNDCIQVYPTAPNYSFARLRRVWQTTQAFWQTALDARDADGNSILSPVDYRLEIIPQNRSDLDLGHYHAYDLRLTSSVKLSVVWDSDNQRFITCDNLEYLAKPELLGKSVIDFLTGELILEEPAGYGGKNKRWGKITVEQAGEMKNSSYIPAIPILAQPRTFMALVPADKALDIVQAIKAKYEREMGKVRNRLPLHLGLVYFQRRTPLRAALDAGRRMLTYESGRMKDDVWQVTEDVQKEPLPNDSAYLSENGNGQFAETVTVKLAQHGRALTWHVPAKMGDGQTDDNWYPYIFIQRDVSSRSRVFQAPRPKPDGTTEECWLVHAADLKKDDLIYFTPATLDFQWLDSAGRRFEIAYDENGRRRSHLSRPYLLDQLATIQQAWALVAGPRRLTSSQIYALRDLIETKRESWRPTAKQCQKKGIFWRFCHDAVVNANWGQTPAKAQLEQLTDWAISGLFTDMIQLYMGIMKQKPQQEEEENE